MDINALVSLFLRGFRSRVVAAIGGFFFVATACDAGTVSANLTSYGNNSNDPLVYTNSANGAAVTATMADLKNRVGLFNWVQSPSGNYPGLGNTFTTFCVDLNTAININSTSKPYVYNVSPFTQLPVGPNTTNSSAVNAIARLYNGYYNQIGNSTIKAAAFQLAIWRLEYDWGQNTGVNPYALDNFSAGNFQAGALTMAPYATDSGNTLTLASQLIDNVVARSGAYSMADSNLVILTNSTDQAQLAVVPEPSTMCLAAIGGVTLLVGRFRRRQNVAT